MYFPHNSQVLQGFWIVNYQANSLNKYIEITFPKAAGFQLFLYGVEPNFLKSKQYRSSRCPKSCLLVLSQAQASCKYNPTPEPQIPPQGESLGFPIGSKPNSPKKCKVPSLHSFTSPTCSWSCLNTCKQQPTWSHKYQLMEAPVIHLSVHWPADCLNYLTILVKANA